MIINFVSKIVYTFWIINTTQVYWHLPGISVHFSNNYNGIAFRNSKKECHSIKRVITFAVNTFLYFRLPTAISQLDYELKSFFNPMTPSQVLT